MSILNHPIKALEWVVGRLAGDGIFCRRYAEAPLRYRRRGASESGCMSLETSCAPHPDLGLEGAVGG